MRRLALDNTVNQNENTRFKKRIFGTALIILILLTLLSAILLTIRLINYISVDDREVMLESGFDKPLDIFSVQYKNSSGEITVSGMDGQKVVAPGTAVDYTIRLRNKDKTAIDYELVPTVTFTSEHVIPIEVRMLDYDGNYIIGDAKTWVAASELTAVSDSRTLVKGESAEYIFEWRWEFESGNDEYDTFLGDIPNAENVGLTVKFELHAEANTDIGANGGVIKSGLGDIIIPGIAFILLIVAIVLLIIYLKKKKELEPIVEIAEEISASINEEIKPE